jgi:hypothetical protein
VCCGRCPTALLVSGTHLIHASTTVTPQHTRCHPPHSPVPLRSQDQRHLRRQRVQQRGLQLIPPHQTRPPGGWEQQQEGVLRAAGECQSPAGRWGAWQCIGWPAGEASSLVARVQCTLWHTQTVTHYVYGPHSSHVLHPAMCLLCCPVYWRCVVHCLVPLLLLLLARLLPLLLVVGRLTEGCHQGCSGPVHRRWCCWWR